MLAEISYYEWFQETWPKFSDRLENYLPYAWPLLDEFIKGCQETLYMLGITIVFAGFFGIVLGVLMVLVKSKGILACPSIYRILEVIVNLFRSIPFIILLALLVPITRMIVKTSIGPTAATVPIIVGTIPFFARQVEIALLEVKPGVIEAALAMGASPWDIVYRVYLREGLVALLRVSASTVINVLGLTVMAGAVGAGGLGTIAISRGYQRSRMDVILVATFLILVIVFISQLIFNVLIKIFDHSKSE